MRPFQSEKSCSEETLSLIDNHSPFLPEMSTKEERESMRKRQRSREKRRKKREKEKANRNSNSLKRRLSLRLLGGGGGAGRDGGAGKNQSGDEPSKGSKKDDGIEPTKKRCGNFP